MNKPFIKYFGFGTNKDLDMMVHIVGRSDLVGEPGKLIGFDVCIQKSSKMRSDIPETTPFKVPPKDLVIKNWGPDFDMFVSVPNPDGIAYGTIWELTQEEIDLVKEWEAVDYGLQDEVWAIAIDSKGHFVQVETQTLLRPTDKIDRVITGEDYNPYVASKKAMLDLADDVRTRFLERRKKGIR